MSVYTLSPIEKTVSLESFSDNDGKVVLNFYENNMEVRGDFYPSRFDGRPINQDYMRRLFDEHRINYGLQRDAVSEAMRVCVFEHSMVTNVLVAKGDLPEDEIPEHLQINPNLEKSKNPKELNGSIDHRTRSPFIIVKKDQVLAVVRKRKPGKNGMNVHWETINHGTASPNSVTAGENTRMEGKYLLSNIDGQLLQTRGSLSVRDTLIIKGPVGYRTGNISFPGDVFIEGPVSDGFRIISGGSITIKQTFDVTDAKTKRDLDVAGGIVGRGQARLKVGGNLRTKFIENCRIACRKKVFVELEIVNSKIYTMETLEMGEKGRIVGGEIYAIQGLHAGGIGKITGRAARIHCGVDFTKEQEKEVYKEQLKALSVNISRVREMLENSESSGEKQDKLEEKFRQLEKEQNDIQKKLTDLLESMNHNEEAVIEVRGEIVPGTLIEICHTALFVTEPLKKVRIRLDKSHNKLITENF